MSFQYDASILRTNENSIKVSPDNIISSSLQAKLIEKPESDNNLAKANDFQSVF